MPQLLRSSCLLALSLAPMLPVMAVEVFVSPTGRDDNAGTQAAPVASLAGAQQVAQRHAGKEAVTVTFADGVYYLPAMVTFTPADAGTKDKPVVYRAAHEGRAVLSGGQKLNLTWAPHQKGIFKATVPADLACDQIFVNGVRQRMARYPNFDPAAKTKAYNGYAADAFSPARAAGWADPIGGYIHAMHAAHWGGYHFQITGKNAKGEVTFEGGWQNNRKGPIHRDMRMVENIFEELDAPGEWFHDRKTHTLYLMPETGVDLASAMIEAVRLPQLIEFRGTPEKPVTNIALDGFVFRHAARTFMQNKEPLLRSDWTIFRSGAVFFSGARDCTIANSEFDQMGANAIFVNNWNRGITITGCHIHHAGASAVAFVGDPKAVRSPLFEYGQKRTEPIDLTPGPLTDNYPADCVVEDSLIHNVGQVEKQGAGVQISISARITVRQCSIYETSRAGININEGTFGGHVIDGCDVFDTVQETGDHGSFNSWGRDRFWPPNAKEVAKNPELPFLDMVGVNIIRNSRWRCDHGWDIDLDDGSTRYEITNNLCLRGGIKNREGYHRTVTNNIMVNNGFHPHVWPENSGDVFAQNIVMSAHRPAIMGKGKWGKEVDRNLFTTSHADRLRFAANGCDANSIVADPNFIDPTRGDFRVQPDSPALALGFKNFPMDRFGVLKPALKTKARTPTLPEVKIAPNTTPPTAAQLAKLTGGAQPLWMGATVKNLEGEEFSAFGVARESGGVMLVEVPAGSALAGMGLVTGDLVQGIGKTPVKKISDLGTAIAALSGEPTVTVVRKQQATVLKVSGEFKPPK